MDIEFTEEQRQLKDTAQKFLGNEAPLRSLWDIEGAELGFSPDLWRRMAELGWLGIPYPEEYGGFRMGSVDTVVLTKELGRALCQTPFIPTVLLSGGAILAGGSEAQKNEYLPRIASGELILAFAFQEGRLFDYRGIATTAVQSAGRFVLNGTKMFVEFAHAANRLLVVARTSGDRSSELGLTMLLVDPKAPGVRLSPLPTMARDRQFKVTFDNVEVAATDAIGEVGSAWASLAPVLQRGVVGFCGYMVGASEKIHEMANDFAKERVQFGRPIGSFQAIQHYLAQTIAEIISADMITFYAAWTLDRGLPAGKVVAQAKACAGDTFKQASAIGAQIYGGIGYIEGVDTTLFLRRGKQFQLAMGDSGYWEDALAQELLDR